MPPVKTHGVPNIGQPGIQRGTPNDPLAGTDAENAIDPQDPAPRRTVPPELPNAEMRVWKGAAALALPSAISQALQKYGIEETGAMGDFTTFNLGEFELQIDPSGNWKVLDNNLKELASGHDYNSLKMLLALRYGAKPHYAAKNVATESTNRTAKKAVEGTMDNKSLREQLREKIAARKAEREAEAKTAAEKVASESKVAAETQKYARLRQVAMGEAKEVDEALNEVSQALATMSEGLTNLRENLDLVQAPKTANLKVRIAAARKYATAFKQVANDTPEVIVDAVAEIYNSLDEIAAGLENLAENMGFEIPTSPAMDEVIEEGEEELAEAKSEGESVSEEIKEEADDMTEEIEGDKDVDEPGEDNSPEEKEASGADNFIMDNSEKGVEHMDIPQAKGAAKK